MRNEDNWENSTNRNMRFFDEWSGYIFLVIPPYGRNRSIGKCQSINYDECSKYIFLTDPVLLREYNSVIQNNESSLEQ